MPVYEFKCKKCEYLFEEYLPQKSEQILKCPVCNGEVEKQISVTNFKINGFSALNGYSLANK